MRSIPDGRRSARSPRADRRVLERWREGYDVVYATRRKRKGEGFFKLLTARAFYRTVRRLTNVSIPVDTGDFRLMSRRVVEALKQISRERHRFLRGLVSWIGYPQIGVEYDRDERFSGATKYPLSKMFRFAIDGITSFSEIPLRFALVLRLPGFDRRLHRPGNRRDRDQAVHRATTTWATPRRSSQSCSWAGYN